MERDLLMIPGPTMADPAVLRALSAPVMGHVSPEFLGIFGRALEGTRAVLGGARGAAFILAGSGTLALEFGAANLLEPGDRILVTDTGVFANRFSQICERYDAQITLLTAPLGDVVPLEAIEAELKQGGYKAVQVCHVDTSTDVRVDVAAVARLAAQYGALLLVDGVCAAGGLPVECDAWGVDVYMTASQKAFGVPPGLVICWMSERAIAAVKARKRSVRNFYCDALAWLPVMQNMEARKPGYFATPPTNLICGYEVALQLIMAETLQKRMQRHELYSRAFKAGIEALGLLQVPLRPAVAAPTLTCAYLPEGVDGSFIGRVRAQGVVIAGGIHSKAKPYFRVGHMGTVTSADLLATLGAIEIALRSMEHELTPGAGAGAALRVLGGM